MSISIDPKTRIAGYALGVVKAALKSLRSSGSPNKFIDLAIFPNRRDGAIVFEECLSRGLIDPETGDTLTEAGETFRLAKLVKRTALPAAQAILDTFVANIHALNTSKDPPVYVEKIWLFGSLMRREETVGDIDIGLRLRTNAPLRDSYESLARFVKAMVKRYPDAPLRFSYPGDDYIWVKTRAIFGPRRHPLLSGVTIGESDLIDLAVPCQLIYDLARGGHVNNPVLDRHPDAGKRADTIEERRTAPDLTAGPVLPLRPEWITDRYNADQVSPCLVFRDWTEECFALFPRHPFYLRILTRESDNAYRWIPKPIDMNSIDGRNKIVLTHGNNISAFAVVLNRKITATPTLWTIKASISDFERKNSSPLVFEEIHEVAAAIALIVATDAEHMLRRAAEDPARPAVAITIKEHPDSVVNETLVARVFEHLQTRTVMIEPPGYPSVTITKG